MSDVTMHIFKTPNNSLKVEIINGALANQSKKEVIEKFFEKMAKHEPWIINELAQKSQHIQKQLKITEKQADICYVLTYNGHNNYAPPIIEEGMYTPAVINLSTEEASPYPLRDDASATHCSFEETLIHETMHATDPMASMTRTDVIASYEEDGETNDDAFLAAILLRAEPENYAVTMTNALLEKHYPHIPPRALPFDVETVAFLENEGR